MNEKLVRALAVAAMALLIIGAILMVDWPSGGSYDEGNQTTDNVGFKLLGTDSDQGYGLVVFLTGVLLLVALLGGVFLAKGEEKE
jgi:NADH:ubiquinone oxidoreductase subunit 6 (subunit J)